MHMKIQQTKYTHENSALRLLCIAALGQYKGQINCIAASELSVGHQWAQAEGVHSNHGILTPRSTCLGAQGTWIFQMFVSNTVMLFMGTGHSDL